MNTGLTTDNLITPKELASLLKLSTASVYRLVDTRTLPFYKVGGALRFSKIDIDKYLNTVRIEPLLK